MSEVHDRMPPSRTKPARALRTLRATRSSSPPLPSLPAHAHAAPARPQLNITGYVITADLDPATNKLTATADVTFTALEDLTPPPSS